MTQTRRTWRPLSGVLLLDKPAGVSSNAALQKARRLYQAAKGGHTGNLDPIATGLLPLCFGEATKFAQYLLDSDKGYDAVFRLGQTTTTGDSEGEVVRVRPVGAAIDEVRAALAAQTGPVLQVPPMYSALKVDGRKLYDYARAGQSVERAPRPVVIHALDLLAFDGEFLSVRVSCSKGTYVRVIGETIGEALGCGAHMVALRRTRTGGFDLAGAQSLEALEALDDTARDALLLPADSLLAPLPALALDAGQARSVRQGQSVRLPADARPGEVRVYDPEGVFLGTGEIGAGGVLAPKRLLATGNN